MLEIFHFLGAVFLGLEKKEHKHLKKALCCIATAKGLPIQGAPREGRNVREETPI